MAKYFGLLFDVVIPVECREGSAGISLIHVSAFLLLATSEASGCTPPQNGGISVPMLVSCLILNELVDRARVPAAVSEQAILNGGSSVADAENVVLEGVEGDVEGGVLCHSQVPEIPIAVLVAVVLIVENSSFFSLAKCWPYPKLLLL